MFSKKKDKNELVTTQRAMESNLLGINDAKLVMSISVAGLASHKNDWHLKKKKE